MPKLPRLLITMGESAGIGPELLVKIAQTHFDAQLVVLADPQLLKKVATKLNLSLSLTEINWSEPAKVHQPGHLYIEPHRLPKIVEAGTVNPENAATTLAILYRASDLALENKVDAVVTAPVHKAVLNQLDESFYGHTEFFAKQAGSRKVVMMLAIEGLRMSLATTHVALKDVASAITRSSLTETISVILNEFEKLNIKPLKIAICGLNPHAGEDGILGTEEQDIIAPVIQSFQQQGHGVYGPFPADTLFTRQKRQQYQLFLAMYHDQGLPVIKALGFGQCANITLGLPYIRTSVDHGTALDIAAKYQASRDSLVFAINYAIQLAVGKLPK